jgi:hypothetical protein
VRIIVQDVLRELYLIVTEVSVNHVLKTLLLGVLVRLLAIGYVLEVQN